MKKDLSTGLVMARLERESYAEWQKMLPQSIKDLQDEIQSRTRLAELHHSVSSEIDEEAIRGIVELKLRLDAEFAAWAKLCSVGGDR